MYQQQSVAADNYPTPRPQAVVMDSAAPQQYQASSSFDARIPTMPDTPTPRRLHNQQQQEGDGRSPSSRSILLAPQQGKLRDWEGYSSLASPTPQQQQQMRLPSSIPAASRSMPLQSASASVSVLAPAVDTATYGAQQQQPGPPGVRGGGGGGGGMDHQSFLQWRREEYKRRLECEARGERFIERRPYSSDFVETLPYGGNPYVYDPSQQQQQGAQGQQPGMDINFIDRSNRVVQPQVVGTREEIAWLHPPPIPLPVGWNGYWDLCAGHEHLLQLMALSGVNQSNSPTLVEHFMYPELISCLQRLQYGTYLVHYTRGEAPHERYFYLKTMALANKSQYAPFFCWSQHRHSHQAIDCIPLCNVMWVTAGSYAANFKKYLIGAEYVQGPFVGKRRAECLVNGCMSVWIFDGGATRTVDVVATDPLVFTMWMKLFEDTSQLNAALDVTGNVRALQRDIESSIEAGTVTERTGAKKKKSSILSSSSQSAANSSPYFQY